jgi:hypothetical protein
MRHNLPDRKQCVCLHAALLLLLPPTGLPTMMPTQEGQKASSTTLQQATGGALQQKKWCPTGRTTHGLAVWLTAHTSGEEMSALSVHSHRPASLAVEQMIAVWPLLT